MSIGLLIWCWILIAPAVGIVILNGLGGAHSAMGDGPRY